MCIQSKKRSTNLKIICYEFVLVIILIINHLSYSVQISSNKDPKFFYNRTNYNHIAQILRRHSPQTLNNNECEIPPNPQYTKYTILDESKTSSYRAGNFVSKYSVLGISCTQGYHLSHLASNASICLDGIWNPVLTACIRTCPSLISSATTRVKCSYNNIPLENCINPVKGTIAVLSCNSLYEEPNIRRNPVRVCRESRWDPTISHCYPICGVKHPKAVANMVNAQDVRVGNYPWHVGIYNSTTKGFLCGGSIIDVNIILTAAHCITDYDGNVQPASMYSVAAGKYYSKYNEMRDEAAQYSNILRIHVPERYTGIINMFALDIAILILSDPFTISQAVQPVCIDLNEESQSVHLSSNNEGVVTGWGYTQKGGDVSDVLKELIIPYIPFNQCFSEIPSSFRRYFTQDKIYGGYKNNTTSVCHGDSGGALVFKNIFSDRYFVKGIVSTSPATEELTCDSNQYSLYTNVDNHINFVRDIVAFNQLNRNTIECVSNDCANEKNQNLDAKGHAPGDSDNVESRGSSLPDISKHKNINLLASTSDCGICSNKKHIVSGAKTELFEFPWMALLLYENDRLDNTALFRCAGTIINDRYILTAANCITDLFTIRVSKVRVGEYNLTSDPDCETEGENSSVCADPVQDIEIEDIIPHPDYNADSKNYNIGLLRLRTPIQFSHSVRPVCLPTITVFKFENFRDTKLIVTGWGTNSPFGDSRSNDLMKAEASILSEMECQQVYRKFTLINIDHTCICAGGTEEDNCHGDSGGPLQGAKLINNNLQYIQFGIASYSPFCESVPSLYTKIDLYMEWILDNIKI